MPELPEVETTLRGIKPHLYKHTVCSVTVRHYHLRWPILPEISKKLTGHTVQNVERRAKYLLVSFKHGTLIIHLGMSGSLKIVPPTQPLKKHDHIDIQFTHEKILRYTDPRRFGAFVWTETNPHAHPLLKNLGPEPLSDHFTSNYLWNKLINRKIPIKSFIMNNQIVVGVGNIYAAEALFMAGINPQCAAGLLSKSQCRLLVKAIKTILTRAIQQGGTTLKDFLNSQGKPGYFAQHLNVYGRAGLPCNQCGTTLTHIYLGQRSTVYCACCQT